jgi:hypothetical protein
LISQLMGKNHGFQKMGNLIPTPNTFQSITSQWFQQTLGLHK